MSYVYYILIKMSRIRFKVLQDNDADKRYISKKLNNGDFDYWLVIEVLYMDEYVPDPEFKYMVTLQAVSPSEAGEDRIQDALECTGLPMDVELTDWLKVALLSECGYYAQLWNDGGDNLKELLKEAREQADISTTLFGFYMDRPMNMIGATGWDFIRGEITPNVS